MAQLKSFKSFSEGRVRPVVVTFGRFNPPTIGHGKLLDKVVSLADGNNYRIYASQTEDPKKNPIPYVDKIKFMRRMFPKMGRNIIEDKTIKNILALASKMTEEKYTKLVVVVGSDRVSEFKTLLDRYNGSDKTNYFFKDGIEVVSAGDRDPDSEDAVAGMSASKMREAAQENDLIAFSKGLPKSFGDAKDLFNAVRVGMGLNESYNFRKHVRLNEVSSVREDYVAGRLFRVGDKVQITECTDEFTVTNRGPNFVVIANAAGKTRRAWLNTLTLVQ